MSEKILNELGIDEQRVEDALAEYDDKCKKIVGELFIRLLESNIGNSLICLDICKDKAFKHYSKEAQKIAEGKLSYNEISFDEFEELLKTLDKHNGMMIPIGGSVKYFRAVILEEFMKVIDGISDYTQLQFLEKAFSEIQTPGLDDDTKMWLGTEIIKETNKTM